MWESPSHRLLSAGRQRGRQQLASRFIEATALLCAISWFVVSLYGALNAGSSAPLNRRELRGTAPLDSVSPSAGFLLSSDVTPSPVPTVRPAVNARREARRVKVPEEGRHTVCLAWRAYSNDIDIHAPDEKPERDQDKDTFCNSRVQGPGYCEIADLDLTADGAVSGVTRRAMPRSAGMSYPSEVSCQDAPEYDSFQRLSLEYRHGTPKSRRQPPGPSASRGIVMAVHNGVMVSAYSSIRLLRQHGCTLPIELWSFPDEVTSTYQPYLQELVSEHGVTLREIAADKRTLCHEPRKCFSVKPYALFHSRFESVLLMDADNFAARDPTFLFDTPEFAETGALFWPDYWHPGKTIFHVDNSSMLWDLTGVPFTDAFEQESGQLLVNRTRHARALHLLMYYAQPNNLLWRWQLVWGDKDLYRLAWMRLGAAFHMIPHPPGAAGQYDHVQGAFCGMTMVQFDAAGEPLFFHRNTYKLSAWPNQQQSVWDVYMRFTGTNPLENYSVDTSFMPVIKGVNFMTNTCYGHIYRPPDWEVVRLNGRHPTLGGLEADILKYAGHTVPVRTGPHSDESMDAAVSAMMQEIGAVTGFDGAATS